MSYLLFMDESGHDRRIVPYEVRGGVALHADRLWPFAQAMLASEEACFGAHLDEYGSEIKGHTLLDKDRFRWAAQASWLDDTARRKHALAFLNKGAQRRAPTRIEFTAYGQACLALTRRLFQLLREHDATLFAAAIPRAVRRPNAPGASEFLRKDHVLLLERYFHFLKGKQESGLLVMDETDKKTDRQFMQLLRRYFTRTELGRYRASWIVPAPLFVSSDMTYPIQAADVCVYCINWGFRLPSLGMDAPTREEIASEFGPWVSDLQFHGETHRDGEERSNDGIVYVPDPYSRREA